MAVVVGIFPNHDAVSKLADSLKAGGFDLDELTVVANSELPEGLISDGVEFVLTGEAEEASLSGGTGLITSQGTDVPGLTDSKERIELFVGPTTVEALGDLNVPDGRTDDYLDALEAGRSVAGYNAGSDVEKVKPLFTGAGALSTEVF